MPQSISTHHKPAIAALLALVFASLALAACGGSSKGSSTTGTNASATTPSTGTASSTGTTSSGSTPPGSTTPRSKAPGRAGGRFTAIRECLQKAGITLPKRKPGQTSGGGFAGGAGPTLPKGVTRAQYEAAIKKCGGFAGAGHFRGGAGRASSPEFKEALTRFATCMRENGIDVPPPNTSGNGPIFSTKGLNTASAKFRSTETKCSAVLRSTFRPSPGAAGAAPPTSGG